MTETSVTEEAVVVAVKGMQFAVAGQELPFTLSSESWVTGVPDVPNRPLLGSM